MIRHIKGTRFDLGFFVPTLVLVLLVVLFIAILFGTRFLETKRSKCQIEGVELFDPKEYPTDRSLTEEEFEELKKTVDEKYQDWEKQANSFECK